MATKGPKVQITGDASGLKRAVNDADRSMGKLGKSANGLKGHIGGLSSGFKSLGLIAGGAAVAGVAGLAVGLKECVKESIEAENQTAQTNAVLKSTGGVAGVSKKHVLDLASALAYKSGIDDQVIQSGENMLLTFKGIRNEAGKGNDIFDQTTKAAIDMSVAMGTDAKSAALTLGKALNDPAQGLSKLTKQGVTFTDSQKAQIIALSKAGKTMEAQKIILKELNGEFGGSADAAGKTFAGKMNIAKVALGGLKQTIGDALLPILSKAAVAFANLIKGLTSGKGTLGAIGNTIKNVIGGAIKTVGPLLESLIKAIGPAFESFTSAVGPQMQGNFKALTGVVGGLFAGLKQLLPTMLNLYQTLYTGLSPVFRTVAGIVAQLVPVLLKVVQAIVAALLPSIKKIFPILQQFAAIIKQNMPQIKAMFMDLLPVIKTLGKVIGFVVSAAIVIIKKLMPTFKVVFGTCIRIIRDVIGLISALFRGDFKKAFHYLVDILKAQMKNFVTILKAIGGLILEGLKNIGKGILWAFGKMWEGIKKLPGLAFKAIGSIMKLNVGILKNGALLIAKGIISGFDFISHLPKKIIGVMGDVLSYMGKLPSKFLSLGGKIVKALLGAFVGIAGKIASAIGGGIGTIGNFLRDWINKNTLFGNKIDLPGPLPDIKIPALAQGGKTGGPMYLVGEGRAPEYVIPTDPAYRDRAKGLLADAASSIGMTAFAKGGKTKSERRQSLLDSRAARYGGTTDRLDLGAAHAANTATINDDVKIENARIKAAQKRIQQIKQQLRSKWLTKDQKNQLIAEEASLLGDIKSITDAQAQRRADRADAAISGADTAFQAEQASYDKQIAIAASKGQDTSALVASKNASIQARIDRINQLEAQGGLTTEQKMAYDQETVSLMQSLNDGQTAANDLAQQQLDATKAQNELLEQQVANQALVLAKLANEKESLMGSLAAFLSGDIGGKAGLGSSTPATAGVYANY